MPTKTKKPTTAKHQRREPIQQEPQKDYFEWIEEDSEDSKHKPGLNRLAALMERYREQEYSLESAWENLNEPVYRLLKQGNYAYTIYSYKSLCFELILALANPSVKAVLDAGHNHTFLSDETLKMLRAMFAFLTELEEPERKAALKNHDLLHNPFHHVEDLAKSIIWYETAIEGHEKYAERLSELERQ